jgi:hypothetical protein
MLAARSARFGGTAGPRKHARYPCSCATRSTRHVAPVACKAVPAIAGQGTPFTNPQAYRLRAKVNTELRRELLQLAESRYPHDFEFDRGRGSRQDDVAVFVGSSKATFSLGEFLAQIDFRTAPAFFKKALGITLGRSVNMSRPEELREVEQDLARNLAVQPHWFGRFTLVALSDGSFELTQKIDDAVKAHLPSNHDVVRRAPQDVDHAAHHRRECAPHCAAALAPHEYVGMYPNAVG